MHAHGLGGRLGSKGRLSRAEEVVGDSGEAHGAVAASSSSLGSSLKSENQDRANPLHLHTDLLRSSLGRRGSSRSLEERVSWEE